MRIYLTIIILISTINLFGQNPEQKTIELSEIKLCELTLSELKKQDGNLKEVELIEMDLCSDGFVQDSRFENRKGYISKLYNGIIFQKDRDTELISKIRLTKEFKGKLPDGNYIDLSNLTAEKILVKYPKMNTWSSRGCSDYWSLTDKLLYFYVAIDKTKESRYPIDKKFYLTKPIEGIDIVSNCYEFAQKNKKEPLIILNGKEVTKAEIEKYKPEDIESVTVLNETAIEKYGEKGENGVIIIKTKSESEKQLIGKWILVTETDSFDDEIEPLGETEPESDSKAELETTLTFNKDRTIFINQMGNGYNATYKLTDSTLTIGNRNYILIEIDKKKLIYKNKGELFDKQYEYKKAE